MTPLARFRISLFTTAIVALGFSSLALHAQYSNDHSLDLPPSPVEPHSSSDAPLLFFPALIPPWGSNVPEHQTRVIQNGRRNLAPPELAAYVYESFYPALGSQLQKHTLSKKLNAQLTEYRNSRQALLGDLCNHLEETKGQDAATREKSLHDFAVAQATKLADLEAKAEALRAALLKGGFTTEAPNWFTWREWHLGDSRIKPGLMERSALFQIARATAYYQAGLSSESRGLLVELADDLRKEVHLLRRIPSVNAVAFSPALARLNWPADASPELRQLIDAYTAERNALKDEWLGLIRREEQSSFIFRERRFREFSEQQAARQAGLELKAEEIRHVLAAQPKGAPPIPIKLPADLSARLDAYRTARQALSRELFDKLANVRPDPMPPASNRPLSPNERTAENINRARASIVTSTERRKAAEQTFRTENKERFEALDAEEAALRQQLTDFAKSTNDPVTGQPYNIATLMRTLNGAQGKLDQWSREETIYRDYGIAMLEPGLSSAQRRLLFGAAVVSLSQDLPDGQPMPVQFMLQM